MSFSSSSANKVQSKSHFTADDWRHHTKSQTTLLKCIPCKLSDHRGNRYKQMCGQRKALEIARNLSQGENDHISLWRHLWGHLWPHKKLEQIKTAYKGNNDTENFTINPEMSLEWTILLPWSFTIPFFGLFLIFAYLYTRLCTYKFINIHMNILNVWSRDERRIAKLIYTNYIL